MKIPGIKKVRHGDKTYYYDITVHPRQRIFAKPDTREFFSEVLAVRQGASRSKRVVGINRVRRKDGHYDHYHRKTGKYIKASPDTPAYMAEIRVLNSGSEFLAGSWGALVAAYH